MRANSLPLASTVLPDFATLKIWKQNNPSNFNPVAFAPRKHKRFCGAFARAKFGNPVPPILQLLSLRLTETIVYRFTTMHSRMSCSNKFASFYFQCESPWSSRNQQLTSMMRESLIRTLGASSVAMAKA
jgi:hypothetical protein